MPNLSSAGGASSARNNLKQSQVKENSRKELQTLEIPFNLLTPNVDQNSRQKFSALKGMNSSGLRATDSKSEVFDNSEHQVMTINGDSKTERPSKSTTAAELKASGLKQHVNQELNQNNKITHSGKGKEKSSKLNEQERKILTVYGIESEKVLLSSREEHESPKSISEDDLSDRQEVVYSKEELSHHLGYLENMWQYRYTRYLEDAVWNKRWMRLFSFLGEFKEKCIRILKQLVNTGFRSQKCLDEIDYRFNMKNEGEDGIYLIEGIIVRVARTKNDANSQFNDSAVKGLHQEYLAYNILNNLCVSLLKTDFETVRVPLTSLVKYHGFTALCQADTPCEGLETLIHGPTATIYQYREESMPILRAIGEQLNLKEFQMLSKDGKSLSVPFSLTVELHKITRQLKNESVISWIDPNSVLYPPNGHAVLQKPQYYLLNVRKLWPLFIDSDIVKSSGHLRPEVVLSWKTKLSNTVFSNVSYREHPNSELELADACKNLKEQNVKVLARMLDDTTIFLIDSEGIEQILHEYGVNMRFMGFLAQKVTLEFSKKVLETEMIARTCKKYFFSIFDELCQDSKQCKDVIASMKENFVDFLNLIFIRNDDGERFFQKFIYDRIRSYYEYDIRQYPPNIPGGGLLHAIAYHFGIKVKVIDYPFFQAGVDSIFNTSHITDIVGFARVFDMETSEVKLLCRKFKEKRKKNNLQECISELKILGAINKCLGHDRTHNIGSYPQSYFYAELAEIYFNRKDYEKARYYAQVSLKSIPEKHADSIKPFGVLIKYYSVKKEINRCIEYYEKSLSYLGYHLSPDHPLTISVYNTLGYEFVSSMDPAKCEKIFMKSFQICEQALGYMHHTSSEILMQLAGLPLPPEKTINFLLQALTILENLGDHHELMQEVSMRISQQYNKLGNVQKMIYFARKSGHWRMEITGEDKLNHDRTVFELANRVPTSTSEVEFLVFYSVKAYLRNLDRISKDNLYKLFVNLQEELSSKEEAAQSLLRRLTEDRSSINNVSDFIKSNFQSLIREIPRMLAKSHFYTAKIEEREKYTKVMMEVFLDIMSIIGKEDVESFFNCYKKTF